MKKATAILIVLLFAVSSSAYAGGIFDKNTGGDSPSSNTPAPAQNGDNGKPSILSANATHIQRVNKLDEIIVYCNAHPTRNNKNLLENAMRHKSIIESESSYSANVSIGTINEIIRRLE